MSFTLYCRDQEVERRTLALMQTCDPTRTTFKQMLTRQNLTQGDATHCIKISAEEYRGELDYQLRKVLLTSPADESLADEPLQPSAYVEQQGKRQ